MPPGPPLQFTPPRVVAPLSPCNTAVRLQGLVPGANILIRAIGPGGGTLYTGTASQADQVFSPLLRPLQAGQTVSAQQWSSAGPGSDFTPAAFQVKVLEAPTNPGDLGPLSAVSHIYTCGEYLWLDGAFPGAAVTVTAGGVLRGTVPTTVDGNARMQLLPQTGSGDVLLAQQTACGVSSPLFALPVPDGLPARHRQPPLIREPLSACDWHMNIENVLDGATVTLIRAGGDETVGFDRSALQVNLVDDLQEGERIYVVQAFPQCKLASDPSDPPAQVGPPDRHAPTLCGPICNRDRSVLVSGLIRDADVRFLDETGAEFAASSAWDETCEFLMPDLASIQSLRVKQGHCSPVLWSDPSNEVPVDAQPMGELTPRLVGPLFDGGRLVHVEHVFPGSPVWLWSQRWDGPIGYARADDYECDVPAVVPLTAPDVVWVVEWLCGDAFPTNSEPVQDLPKHIPPPVVDNPICDLGGSVHVTGVVPGATVEVYADGVFAGDARSSLDHWNVPLPQRLEPTQGVQARQSIRDRRTDLSVPPVPFTGDTPLVFIPGSTGQVSDRIAQMTGSSDPQPSRAHLNHTDQYGVRGTDLGIPLEHGGVLYLFFGDEGDPAGATDPNTDADPIFYTTDVALRPAGFKMQPILQASGTGFRRLSVPEIGPLDNFEVPTGGFSWNGKLHIFVAKRGPNPDHNKSMMMRSFLASAADAHDDFHLLFGGPVDTFDNPGGNKFINVAATVVDNAAWAPGLPSAVGPGLLLWGAGNWRDGVPYRDSPVCLAWAPLAPGQDPPPPAAWRFFRPKAPSGSEWSAPGDMAAAEPLPGPTGVGELSVGWVPQMRRWVMLFSQGTIQAAVCRTPWGPWDKVQLEIFEPVRDGALSVYMHVPGNDGLGKSGDDPGGAYGPYLLSRFTRWERWRREATLSYLMSTHVPYQVQLMQVRLTCG